MCVPYLPAAIDQIRNKSGLGKACFRCRRLFSYSFPALTEQLLLQAVQLPWVGWDLLMMSSGCGFVFDRACVLVFHRACVLDDDPATLRADYRIETNL